jgi:hypothetical protein
MKVIYQKLFLVIFLSTVLFALHGQKAISDRVSDFSPQIASASVKSITKPVVYQGPRSIAGMSTESCVFFKMDPSNVLYFLREKPEVTKLPFTLPNGELIELRMFRADVFTAEFNVYLASNREVPFLFERGVHYWGIVGQDSESLASISIFKDEVSGMIRYQDKHYTIGRMEDQSENIHMLYETDNLDLPMDFTCGTDPLTHTIGEASEEEEFMDGRNSGKCVRMYVEVDYDIVAGKGGPTQAANYVSGAFSQVSILYANDGITLQVNELIVWDVVDPYTGPSTSNYLTQFRVALNGVYNGDLAHLVGYQGGGGVAYLNVLCNRQYGIGYSAINATYQNVPTYSWTVMVLAHEIGHNLGSQHTHDCAWNGNSTPIDCCGQNAGYAGSGCPSGFNCSIPDPADGGTIMSYCHLRTVRINLAFGFGPQPRDRMQSRINAASCLQTCGEQESIHDAGVIAILQPDGIPCASSTQPIVQIRNFGNVTLQSVTIQYRIDNNVWSSFIWTGNLAPDATATVNLPAVTYGPGQRTFSARTQAPNGNTDANTSNDLSTKSFEYIEGWCDCNPANASFSVNPLTRQGNGTSTSVATLPSGSKFPNFTISGLDARISGNPNQRYDEEVTVTYVNGSGATVLYGTFRGSQQSSVQVNIQTFVQSISVSLRNGLQNGANISLSVNLSAVGYCSSQAPCVDSDNDGVCDEDDVCPGFDDNLIGTACDDGDPCTSNDTYTTNCDCVGTPVPNCGEEEECVSVTNSFPQNPLTHSGSGFSQTTINFPAGNRDVSFSINNLNAVTSGNQRNRFNERATVLYTNGSGQQLTHGSYQGSQQSSANIEISGYVQSVTVRLDNSLNNNNIAMSISMTAVASCTESASTQGINEALEEMKIFPNPVGQVLYIQLPWSEVAQEFEIMDIHGKSISRISSYGGVIETPVSNWPSGIYIIRSLTGNKKPIKFVKQ